VSRVGKLPIPLPDGVKCEISGTTIKVTGPKGTLVRDIRPEIAVAVEGNEIVLSRPNEEQQIKAYHGLTRALINSMVVGVSQGFEKILQIEGVGYRASLQGSTLTLQVGHSHPVTVDPPEGVTFTVDGPTVIKVAGIDKELVGQVAANVRAKRKPEPYKGKGIRYSTERVRRKEGKSGGK